MDEDLRKTSADIVKARRAATGLLKAAKITTVPIVVNDLVSCANKIFDITVAALTDAEFSGKGDAVTQARGDAIFILYNNDKSVVRKRFSVAHEIGHLYLGHLHGSSSSDLNAEKNFDEIEANAFAAHVLIPPTILGRDIKGGNKDVDRLAKKYNVSTDAMWLQIRNSGLVNAMMR